MFLLFLQNYATKEVPVSWWQTYLLLFLQKEMRLTHDGR